MLCPFLFLFCAQVLGTPTEATWPGVSRLPLYKPQRLSFYRTQKLGHAFPRLYDISQAENLASKLLQVCNKKI